MLFLPFILIISYSLTLSACSTIKDKEDLSVIQYNPYNYNVVMDAKYFYYMDDNGIYKISRKSNKTTCLATVKKNSGDSGYFFDITYHMLTIHNDWLYYTNGIFLNKLNKETGENIELLQKPKGVGMIQCEDDTLYLISGGKNGIIAYNIKNDPKNLLEIEKYDSNPTYTPLVHHKWEYWSSSTGKGSTLFRRELDGSVEQTLLKNLPLQRTLITYQAIFYVQGDNQSEIWISDLNGCSRKCILKSDNVQLRLVNFDKYWVYYATPNQKVFRIKYNGKDREKITSINSDEDFSVAGGWLFYLSNGTMQKIKIEGEKA